MLGMTEYRREDNLILSGQKLNPLGNNWSPTLRLTTYDLRLTTYDFFYFFKAKKKRGRSFVSLFYSILKDQIRTCDADLK